MGYIRRHKSIHEEIKDKDIIVKLNKDNTFIFNKINV